METHRAKVFYTDPNTKKNKSIIAEGKDEGDAAQNAVKRFKTFFPNLPVTCITRINIFFLFFLLENCSYIFK